MRNKSLTAITAARRRSRKAAACAGPRPPDVVVAMRERGIDVSRYASKGSDEPFIAREIDLVVTMGCGDDACPAFIGKKMRDGGLEDHA